MTPRQAQNKLCHHASTARASCKTIAYIAPHALGDMADIEKMIQESITSLTAAQKYLKKVVQV